MLEERVTLKAPQNPEYTRYSEASRDAPSRCFSHSNDTLGAPNPPASQSLGDLAEVSLQTRSTV